MTDLERALAGEKNLSCADLRDADLRDADLSCADLHGADLHGADLKGADLKGADLHGADLSCADLKGADLSCADLRDADLSDAYLSGADLRYAYLSGADLRYANLSSASLSGANLTGANLTGANLTGATLPEGVPAVPDLVVRLVEAVGPSGEHLNMRTWHHPCGTAHCLAGWTVTLSGEAGAALESRFDTNAAAALIWSASTDQPVPSWFASNEAALADLKKRVST